MSNYDPFNPISRYHQEAFDSRYGSRSSGALWPLLAVIGIVLVAGVVVSL